MFHKDLKYQTIFKTASPPSTHLTSGETPLADVYLTKNWTKNLKSPDLQVHIQLLLRALVRFCDVGRVFPKAKDGKGHNLKEIRESNWGFSPSPHHI